MILSVRLCLVRWLLLVLTVAVFGCVLKVRVLTLIIM